MQRKHLPLIAATVAMAMASAAGYAADAKKDANKEANKPPPISKQVIKSLIAAQTAIKGEKWAECVTNAQTANAFAEKTPYDEYAINDLLGFCALRVGDSATAATSFEMVLNSQFVDPARKISLLKGLMQIYYQGKNYAKAVEFGKRSVAEGVADDDVYLFTAQAFYLQNDYKGAHDFLVAWLGGLAQKGAVPRENAIQLYLSSCIKLGDDACTVRALELAATHYPKPDIWNNLMTLMLRANASSEKALLNIYRLSFEVGAMRRGDDYTEMAQLAMTQGLPGEAQAVLESGIAGGVISSDRDKSTAQAILATAKTQSAADRATLAKQEKDIAAAKTGDPDVKLGLAYLSYGQFPQAVAAIQRGIGKGSLKRVTDAEAQLTLGIAQLRAGDKAAAAASFGAVKGDDTQLRLARLWAQRAK